MLIVKYFFANEDITYRRLLCTYCRPTLVVRWWRLSDCDIGVHSALIFISSMLVWNEMVNSAACKYFCPISKSSQHLHSAPDGWHQTSSATVAIVYISTQSGRLQHMRRLGPYLFFALCYKFELLNSLRYCGNVLNMWWKIYTGIVRNLIPVPVVKEFWKSINT